MEGWREGANPSFARAPPFLPPSLPPSLPPLPPSRAKPGNRLVISFLVHIRKQVWFMIVIGSKTNIELRDLSRPADACKCIRSMTENRDRGERGETTRQDLVQVEMVHDHSPDGATETSLFA